MKHHPAWLAVGLLICVVLACSFGKNTNTNSNSNSNANSGSASSTGADLGSGNAIREIHMAKDDGNGAPGDETDSFAPGDRTIHCVATLREAKSGTAMRFAWWIVDADGSQNQKIKEIDYKTRALENVVHGHLTLPQDWPAGKYKVHVYINGDLDKTAFYSVQ
ncbi:MAG TPA: hypothetical protein VGO73_12310 [Pyrinomonadaceae bacterium]|jgi:hypothetical protein|nr:hypothetical protein [Pyrinomonadaceae bacterium]